MRLWQIDPVMAAFDTAASKVVEYGGAIVAIVLVGLFYWLGQKYLAHALRNS